MYSALWYQRRVHGGRPVVEGSLSDTEKAVLCDDIDFYQIESLRRVLRVPKMMFIDDLVDEIMQKKVTIQGSKLVVHCPGRRVTW
eukprot:NODE_2485_length_351_cov_37.857143_g2475_i0.p1 GENE.NODE_2485_length_351_cov_37.857143_g2475_i0~~NODE_2485_length_351_cov_37.857143_g2475_i0.p1  ORF type:complete len:93 (-),score=32.42 NODE_2485_length_351_cov_37.857143_g2475_i0:71-325(-)